MENNSCYCGSQNSFESCCAPYINGFKKAPTALALMKSRYSAYASHQIIYLQQPIVLKENTIRKKKFCIGR
jgi:SEC-C motif-containing protein